MIMGKKKQMLKNRAPKYNHCHRNRIEDATQSILAVKPQKKIYTHLAKSEDKMLLHPPYIHPTRKHRMEIDN